MAAPGNIDPVVIERWVSGGLSAGNVAQQYVSPLDCDIVGLALSVQTAPGGASTVTVNATNSPTSQLTGTGSFAGVAPFTLWSASMVPTITGSAKQNFAAQLTQTLPIFQPYALNYPLPGPSGTTGLFTAQSTSYQTETPLQSTALLIQPSVTGFPVAPNLTYNDINGFSRPTSRLRVGDVLTFTIGGTIGSAANLSMSLILNKH
jgi:hypothetical protein